MNEQEKFKPILSELMRGGKYGYYWTLNHALETQGKPSKKTIWFSADSPEIIDEQAPGWSVYYALSPSTEKRAQNQRALTEHAAAVNCVFCDYDIKPDNAQGHFADRGAILNHLEKMRATCWPSVIIDTGGGWQALWILADPVLVTDDNREKISTTLKQWETWAGGEKGEGCLVRVFRLPGLVNYKPKYGPNFPTAKIIEINPNRYTLEQINDLLLTNLSRIIIKQTRCDTDEDFVQRQIDRQCQRIIAATPGVNRHTEFIRAAYYVGGLVGAGRISRSAAEGALRAAATHNTTGEREEREAYRVIRDGLNSGEKKPIEKKILWDDEPEEKIIETVKSSGPPDIPCKPQGGLWIDRYIEYSRHWACNSYDGYHLGTALWVLSTIAARRIKSHMGFTINTSLYIVLCGETSIYKKSTVATLGIDFLRACGMDYFLVQDVVTPQKLIQDMAGYFNCEKMKDESPEYQAAAKNAYAFSGQRGWYYDEFDDALQSLSQRDGTMAPYKALFRSLYNCPITYKYGTKSTGTDVIDHPYLALLGSATPQAVKPFLKEGGEMWGNGFLARMTFITPNGTHPKNDMPPDGKPQPPPELMAQIIDWNRRLQTPNVELYTVTDDKGKETERARRGPLPQTEIKIADDVKEAWHTYDTYLNNLAWESKRQIDFGNTRMSDWALRVSLLITSVEGLPEVTMPIWARAYQLALEMIDYQGNLIDKLGDIHEPSKGRELEEKITCQIKKRGALTMRQLRQHIYGASVSELTRTVAEMQSAGLIEDERQGKAQKFKLT